MRQAKSMLNTHGDSGAHSARNLAAGDRDGHPWSLGVMMKTPLSRRLGRLQHRQVV